MHINPSILGRYEFMMNGEQPQLTCTVNYLRDKNVTFTWYLKKHILRSQLLPPITHGNDTATYRSELLHNFTRADDLEQLTCGVSTQGSKHRHVSNVVLLMHKGQTV